MTGTGLNQALTPSYTNNTNVGLATATATYAGTADYAPATGSATFTINPASVTATAGNLTGVYSGFAQSPSACVISGAYAVGVTCTDSPASVGPGIGSGVVTPSVSGAGNFAVTNVNGAWSISPLVATITLGNLAQFYTGSPATPVTVTTVPSGLAVSVLYGTTANPTTPTSATPPTAVGNYAVLATPTNPNYAGTGTGTLSINCGKLGSHAGSSRRRWGAFSVRNIGVFRSHSNRHALPHGESTVVFGWRGG